MTVGCATGGHPACKKTGC